MRRFLRFLISIPFIGTITGLFLGIEETFATQRGRPREKGLGRSFARIDDAGSLIRVAIFVEASLEFQIALLLIRVTSIVANVMEVAALRHFGERKEFLVHLRIFVTICNDRVINIMNNVANVN